MQLEDLLEVESLTIKATAKVVLEDVSLRIKQDEIVFIVGPNGGGKSSLVKVMAGVYDDYQGTVRRQEGLKVAYMPQHFSISPYLPLRVKDFLLLGRPKTKALEWVVDTLGLARLMPVLMHQLSGGELKKALLAKCLTSNPKLLILDEPTANMDINAQNSFYSTIAKIKKFLGCSIVLVSHDLHVVMKGTDRVVCLKTRVCCEGRPDCLVQNKHFIAIFGDNVDLYKHEH